MTALGLALALAGCSLRLETEPPAAPVPDASESARQRTAVDAERIAATAAVVATDDGTSEAVAVLVAGVADAAEAHVEALGGVHEPAPVPGSSPSPSPSEEAAASAADVEDLVDVLVEAGSTARSDVAVVDDGGLARLIGSVAAHRLLAADAIARAAGLDVDALEASRPAVDTPTRPALTPSELAAVVTAEDAAGFVWEVVAARRADSERATAAAHAARHRAAAQAWATSGDVAGTDLDPRRATYPLPAAVADDTDAAAVADALHAVESAIATDYASLVAGAPGDDRVLLVDLLTVTSAAAGDASASGSVPRFPGLPERS
ncbi:DUF4439 domain-containing protein [Cellulomonas carbonis]|uniref:DUF4439 domain-containing protein n=1 Tax=Cellulomonas carbonis T26 TaxID=947969 RepID=A0A0A0BTS6_9CELL|nr:DUF4439 domain-containing protein [Cellulomonas carbonis]KGM11355.1 hypothetical protein N868_10865 [Cellulomonas carbonis T26]GGB97670.1 hypothetical protein GCM10010972_08060 [Cellulomonas carbonis]